ncbi:hypothetical protein J2799_000178 [Chryseobacterium vietnamense]|uniref:hypothetical protein n=1 Tax=Chryseobacterium vietnamense TaxID=866785 RepID=UPI0028564066|nr:hypothetical protein [Chryseobacterium vietnamense]MDR6485693.1 hypothetical protein [Chryseobacterium vietnamense]
MTGINDFPKSVRKYSTYTVPINPVNFTIPPLLSVNETSLSENKVKIYPNPGKQLLNISLSNPHEAFDITLYDTSHVFSKKNNRPDYQQNVPLTWLIWPRERIFSAFVLRVWIRL